MLCKWVLCFQFKVTLSLHPLCTYPNECVHPQPLVHHVPAIYASISRHDVYLVHLMCTFSIMCSTTWNLVLPHRTQKHSIFSLCWHPSYTSMSTCTSLARYLVHTSCILFHSTMYCRIHSNIWARL